MQTMERIHRIVVCLLVFGIVTFVADIALTIAGASIGWYYGLGLCLTALTVFQILSPTGGMPVARIATCGKRSGDQHLPSSTH
jgi:hypothetical protein